MGIQDGEQGKYIIRPTPQTTQVSRGEQSSYASRKSEGALKEGDPQDWGITCVQVWYNAYQLAKGGNAQGRFAKNCKRESWLLRKQIAEHFSAKFSTTELILQSRVCVEKRWQNLHCCSKGFGKQIRIQAGNPLRLRFPFWSLERIFRDFGGGVLSVTSAREPPLSSHWFVDDIEILRDQFLRYFHRDFKIGFLQRPMPDATWTLDQSGPKPSPWNP